MAVAILSYQTSTFNDLPGFEIAGPNFDTVDGKTIITKIMTPLFRKHNVENVIGLQLLHQHFQLNPGEQTLHSHNAVSTTLLITSAADILMGLQMGGKYYF